MYVTERCLQVKYVSWDVQGHHTYTRVNHQGIKQTVPGQGRIQTGLTGLYKPVRFPKREKPSIYITNLKNILFHKFDVV